MVSHTLCSSAELFFLPQERIVLYCILFLFSKDRTPEASAGAATRARRYLTSSGTALTFWSEIALDPRDNVAHTPPHTVFLVSASISSLPTRVLLLPFSLYICPNVPRSYAYRWLGLGSPTGQLLHPRAMLYPASSQTFSWCSLRKAGPSSS